MDGWRRWLPGRLDCGFHPTDRQRFRRRRLSQLCQRACRATGTGDRRDRYSNRLARTREPRRTRCRERREAVAWAAPIVSILGSFAKRDLRARLRGRVSRRASHLGTAAQSVQAVVQHCTEDPGGRCNPARRSRTRDARFRGPSGIGVLAAERRATTCRGKKIKSRPYEPGLILRRKLLAFAGLPSDLTHAPPPKGAAADDLIDALACAAIARRIHAGQAQRFPDPPPLDRHGLPMAIWA
jgi:Protein of unknown function (DUF429)